MINTTTTPGKTAEETKTANSTDGKKNIDSHKQAAAHHMEAAKHHLEAAKYHEAGIHDKAYTSTVKANGHAVMASECQREDVKYHAGVTNGK